MVRSLLRVMLFAVEISFLASAAARAGVPRDMILAANEQTADDKTGVTIARGNAEIVAAAHRIRGTADVIEVRPKINEILFKGRVMLTVGTRSYSSDTVICTLDFIACSAITDDQELPSMSAVTRP